MWIFSDIGLQRWVPDITISVYTVLLNPPFSMHKLFERLCAYTCISLYGTQNLQICLFFAKLRQTLTQINRTFSSSHCFERFCGAKRTKDIINILLYLKSVSNTRLDFVMLFLILSSPYASKWVHFVLNTFVMTVENALFIFCWRFVSTMLKYTME